MKFTKTPDKEWLKKRLIGSGVCISLVFLLLLLRLVFLQIIKGEEYRHLSENNCIRIKSIKSSRGLIYDRDGILLVDNRPSFNLKIIVEDAAPLAKTLEKISALVNIPYGTLLEKVNESKMHSYYRPIVIKKDLSRNKLAVVEAHKFDLPGVLIEVEPRRHYIYEKCCTHLLGYLGEINKEELEKGKYPGIRSGDFIGRYGVEKSFQKMLQGVRGGRQIEVDANGRVIKVLNSVDPVPGKNVYLTVDLDLQEIAEKLLENKSGAVVALDPSNGEVLAMASAPSFDQNDFIGGISVEKWKKLSADENNPMINKAIQGEYPPGSTYKIITSFAALEENFIDTGSVYFCPGSYTYGNRTYRCWKKQGHGKVKIVKALEQSCDVFFYHLGEKIGVDIIEEYAKGSGLGRSTGIELDNEQTGLIPTSRWKMKNVGIPWQGGENLSIAIGQGYNLVTPLQMAVLIAAVGNGGTLYKPTVIKRVENSEGQTVQTIDPEINGGLPASEKTLEIVREGLLKAINGDRGTARGVRLNNIQMAGKTGTAQVYSIKEGEDRNQKQVDFRLRDHAWFVCYAPAENPLIAVSVLIEHGGHGSTGAAPVAREIVKKHLENKGLFKMGSD